MSRLVLVLRDMPAGRIGLAGVTPARLAGLTAAEIARVPIGADGGEVALGDVFAISGAAGDEIVFEGGMEALDGVGAGLDAGTIVVEGDVGDHAASAMTGGRLDIRGNAGNGLASGLGGGLVTVSGRAGDRVGGPRHGERFGMAGGMVFVGGDVGDRAGDRMRRGTIVVKGRCGIGTGSRMMGGTIWTESGIGAMPGAMMRRGTLIAPRLDENPATFADCGSHDLVTLRLLDRHVAARLGPLAPRSLAPKVRKLMGDLATIGKGEILLTG
jgi:formylmethanofuran dehydrogenase subunit C